MIEEPTTVGLSPDAHDKLRRLKEDGYFGEMTDAYRFAIGLAIGHGASPEPVGAKSTILNVGTLDPDKNLYNTIKSLLHPANEPVYTVAERLAEWGILEMWRMAETNTLSFTAILREVQRAHGDSN